MTTKKKAPKKPPTPAQLEARKNLIPASQRTPEERAALGRKGAARTKAIMQERADMKNRLKALVSLTLKDGKQSAELKSLSDARGKNLSVQDAMLISIVNKALRGDVRAVEFIRDTLGEAPVKEMRVEGPIPEPLAPIKDKD